MSIKVLLEMYSFHDMPINYINIDEDSKTIIMNIDYYTDEDSERIGNASNLSLHFDNCFFLEFDGNVDFINSSADEMSGSILTNEPYTLPNCPLQGVKFFIQIINYSERDESYLTLIIVPNQVLVKVIGKNNV